MCREQLVNDIHFKLTEKDLLFLMSFKEGIPDWEKFIVTNAKYLPSINWKLHNIIRLKKENSKKHEEMARSLERALYV